MRTTGIDRRTAGWVFVVGLLFLIAVGFLLVKDRDGRLRVEGTPTRDAPCIGQDHVDLATAIDAQRFQVLLPTASTIGEVVDVCRAEGGGIAIVYSSAIELREMTNDLADPPAAWTGIVDRYPDAGYVVVSVRGSPALAAEPSADSRGGLEWVENGVKFKITGNGTTSVDDLQAIARSLSSITA